MRPRFSINDVAYNRASDSNHFPEFGLFESSGLVQFPYKNYDFISKFVSRYLLSSQNNPSALFVHVLKVLLLSSRAKMFRIAARGSCNTRMTNAHGIWYILFIIDDPRNDMGSKAVPNSITAYHQFTVAGRSASLPTPAIIWACLFYFRPKSLLKFWREYLREKFRGDSLSMHSVSMLIVCHAPGLAIAGAFLF